MLERSTQLNPMDFRTKTHFSRFLPSHPSASDFSPFPPLLFGCPIDSVLSGIKPELRYKAHNDLNQSVKDRSIGAGNSLSSTRITSVQLSRSTPNAELQNIARNRGERRQQRGESRAQNAKVALQGEGVGGCPSPMAAPRRCKEGFDPRFKLDGDGENRAALGWIRAPGAGLRRGGGDSPRCPPSPGATHLQRGRCRRRWPKSC